MKAPIPYCLLAALGTLPALLHAQGPLLPPTTGGGPVGPVPPLDGGNPQASMKTLHQVEPRTPINNDTTPGDTNYFHVISDSGSYYLTKDIIIANKSGILISAADVTIDLNGFSITGFFGGVPSGILIGKDADRCVIRNGSISGSVYGINRTLDGADEAQGGSFENLSVSGQSMIALLGGNGWTVSNCRVHGGSNSGIVVGTGSVVTGCAVSNLGGSFGSNGIEVRAGSTVQNCSVHGCTVLYGIKAGRGCTIVNCTARENGGDSAVAFSAGIFANDRCLIRGCSSTNNTHPTANNSEGGVGINAGFSSAVIDCHTYQNDGDGIRIAQGTRVTGCRSSSNGEGGLGAGIHAYDFSAGSSGWNQIINNDVVFNVTGIDVDTTANSVVQNRSGGNGENFNIIAGNRVGPIVIPSNSGAITGLGNGQAAGMSTTDPWANFTY